MSGWSILILFLILFSLGIIIFRVIKEIQLRKVINQDSNDRLFKRKLAIVEQKQYQSHTLALLFLNLFLLLSLILMLAQTFQVENRYTLLQKQQTKLTAEFKQIKQEKIDLIFNLPVSAYPKSGIGLKDYDWESIVEGKNKEKQLEVELAIAQNLMPYFGVTTAIVVFNAPTQTLHINFNFDLSSKQKQEQALENMTDLILELEGVESVTQVNIQLKNLEDTEFERSEYYVRSNIGDPFKRLESPSEIEEKPVESTTKETQQQKGAVTTNE